MPFGREESESGRDYLSWETAILFWFWQENKLIGAGRGFHQHLCSQVLGNWVLWKPELLNTLSASWCQRNRRSRGWSRWISWLPGSLKVLGMCWCWPMRSGNRWRSLLWAGDTPDTFQLDVPFDQFKNRSSAVRPAHLARICSTFNNVHGRLAWKNADVKWWLTEVLRFI